MWGGSVCDSVFSFQNGKAPTNPAHAIGGGVTAVTVCCVTFECRRVGTHNIGILLVYCCHNVKRKQGVEQARAIRKSHAYTTREDMRMAAHRRSDPCLPINTCATLTTGKEDTKLHPLKDVQHHHKNKIEYKTQSKRRRTCPDAHGSVLKLGRGARLLLVERQPGWSVRGALPRVAPVDLFSSIHPSIKYPSINPSNQSGYKLVGKK